MDDVHALVVIYIDLREMPGPAATRIAEKLWFELVALVGLSEARAQAAAEHRARTAARQVLWRLLDEREGR